MCYIYPLNLIFHLLLFDNDYNAGIFMKKQLIRWSIPFLLLTAACSTSRKSADIGAIYNYAAQHIGDARNPVVVLPGILGSKLQYTPDGRPVWGAFVYGAVDADYPEGARIFALPMKQDIPLSDLRDEVTPTGVLDQLRLDIGFIRDLRLSTYVDIMKTLAAGEYRDETLGESGAVDYGGQHYTCYQYPYDWRRDISENAVALHDMIQKAIHTMQAVRGTDDPVKVDVVAHSMGGLVLRYYLRYGPHPLPDDGSEPELSWEGARYVEKAILIGTPSGGSVKALSELVSGVQYAPLTPTYRPAVLGTLPSIYQLLPRDRFKRVVFKDSNEPVPVMNPDTWQQLGWGLMNPKQDAVLQQLLPEVDDPAERQAIAKDHLSKCLRQAARLHHALDKKSATPDGLDLYLIAGDAEPTDDILEVDPGNGKITLAATAPGDGTVTRASALMDERQGQDWEPRVQTPIDWAQVQFIFSDHLGLTRDPTSQDNLLYLLLERP